MPRILPCGPRNSSFILTLPPPLPRFTKSVPGCPKNKFPEDRSGFKEDAKTKNMIQRRDKGIGASQSQAMQSQAVDIDDL